MYMLRELTREEVGCVSGGHYNEERVPGIGGSGTGPGGSDRPMLPFRSIYGVLPWGADSGNGKFIDTNGDGAADTILVMAPPVRDYDSSFMGSFYARLAGDGTYVQYSASMQNFGIWGYKMTYTPVAYGTYSQAFNDGGFSPSLPLGISYTFSGSGYIFHRQGSL
jgi:hypothetical protein